MSDQVVEIGKILELSQESRFEKDLHRDIVDWTATDFKKELVKLMKRKGRGDLGVSCCRSFAELSGVLTEALYMLKEDGVAEKYDAELSKILFGQGSDSVANCRGKERRREIEDQLVGPISVLTFLDALKKTGNKYAGNLDIKRVMAPLDKDVLNKVDLIFSFGTRTKRGEPVVKLIQLKTTRRVKFYIERDAPGSVRDSYIRQKAPIEDVRKMREYANELEKEGKRAQIFIVVVPAVDSWCVNNVFGVLQPALIGKGEFDRVMKKFCEKVEKTGLLPRDEKKNK